MRPRRHIKKSGWFVAVGGVLLTGALLVTLQQVGHDDESKAERTPEVPVQTGTDVTVRDHGKTLFVATGTAGPGNGSAAWPFGSIQDALQVASAGDTVMVGPGTFAGGFRSVRSGKPDAPIRISGDHSRIIADRSSVRLIELGHDYLELSGFDIVGGTAGVRLHGAHHVRIFDNTIRDATGECVRVKDQSTDNEVAYNDIRNCGAKNFDINEDRKNGEGVYVGTAPEQVAEVPGTKPDHSDANWIHHNRIQTPAECVDIKERSSRNVIEHNVCSGGLDPDGAGISGRGDQVTIRGNAVLGGNGSGIRLGGDGKTDGLNSTVVDNRIDGPQGYGVKIMRLPQGAICGNGLAKPGKGQSNDEKATPSAPCP